MAVDLTTDLVFRLSTGLFCHARNEQASALTAQGKAHTPTHFDQSMTWTNDSPTVLFASASNAGIGKVIYEEDTLRLYKIASVSAGVSYTLDENYLGTTAAKRTNVLNASTGGFQPPSLQPWGGQ